MVPTWAEPYVRTAFATGFALVEGGAVSDDIRDAFLALLETADIDDPLLLETTLQYGKLEGVWAELVGRRRRLESRWQQRTKPATAELAFKISRGAVLHSMVGSDSPDQMESLSEATVEQKRELKAGALAALLAFLQEYPAVEARWRETTRDAAIEAQAEGQASAAILLADLEGMAPVSFQSEFDRAKDALRNLDSFWDTADSWLTDEVQGLAGDLGNAIAGGLDRGASWGDLLSIVEDILGRADGADFYLGEAMATALSDASLSVYADAGVMVDYVTAGDSRVCPECELYEEQGPYSPGAAPTPPVHGACRCVLIPEGGLGNLHKSF